MGTSGVIPIRTRTSPMPTYEGKLSFRNETAALVCQQVICVDWDLAESEDSLVQDGAELVVKLKAADYRGLRTKVNAFLNSLEIVGDMLDIPLNSLGNEEH